MDAAHNWQAWWVMVDLGFNARKSKLLLAKDCGERGYRKNLLVVPFLRVALTATGLVSDGRLSNVLGLSNSHKVYTESHPQLLSRARDLNALPPHAQHLTLASFKGVERALKRLNLPQGQALIDALRPLESSRMTAPLYLHYKPEAVAQRKKKGAQAEAAVAAEDECEPGYEVEAHMWTMYDGYPTVLPDKVYTEEEKNTK